MLHWFTIPRVTKALDLTEGVLCLETWPVSHQRLFFPTQRAVCLCKETLPRDAGLQPMLCTFMGSEGEASQASGEALSEGF